MAKQQEQKKMTDDIEQEKAIAQAPPLPVRMRDRVMESLGDQMLALFLDITAPAETLAVMRKLLDEEGVKGSKQRDLVYRNMKLACARLASHLKVINGDF